MAIRKGDWKLIPGTPELYNLKDDVSETKNVAELHPEIVKKLSDLLAELRQNGPAGPSNSECA